jgi:hypothetical protein
MAKVTEPIVTAGRLALGYMGGQNTEQMALQFEFSIAEADYHRNR